MEELDLKYLQYALAVVRYGSVTQAARALYLAQPNLSRAIGELEQSLGFPLFLRTRQGMSLTPQGERFLTEVETLLDRLSDLARECRQESRRRVHFACVPSSLFVNTVLETARGLPDWSIQCEEYYDCRELFDRVGVEYNILCVVTGENACRAGEQRCGKSFSPTLPGGTCATTPWPRARPTGWSAGPAASTTRRRSRRPSGTMRPF